VRVKVREFKRQGVVVTSLLRQPFTIAYGEILTVERLRGKRGLRLHTRMMEPIVVAVRGSDALAVEEAMRSRGVRIVDCWGCLLTPTLEDFENALGQEPPNVRQSYDNA
jgi:hypothetical protein